MTHRLLTRSSLTIAVLAGGLLPSAGAELPATAAPVVSDPVALSALPDDIEAMVVWALDLFDEAEMELPPLVINHHGEDTEPCNGRIGLHRTTAARSVVELCTDDVSFPTQAMILHELAHAWVDHNVDEERRLAFQELRGYEYWHDYDEARWHENGTEQAAEIIAWGLFDRPMAMLRIHQNSCDELEAGYRTLTETAPLHGFRDKCG